MTGTRWRPDAVSVLSLFILSLWVFPARLVVAPLGGIGTPAVLLGLTAAGLWLLARTAPTYGLDVGSQPVRAALFVYCWFAVLGHAVAHLRPLTPLETSGTVRGLITLAALAGVSLLMADGISSMERLNILLRRAVYGGVFCAAIGITQFTTGFNPVSYIRIPGFSPLRDFGGVGVRSIFNRPASTALHPIEFGVVLALILPLALHFAFHAKSRRERLIAWGFALIIAVGTPMSVSRSAIVALAVSLPILGVAWSARRRINVAAAALIMTLGLWATIPGLVGTFRNLFTDVGNDPSIQARTDRIPRVIETWLQAPWLGRGYGTYSVEDYFLLDNEYYTTLIESGVVGVLVTLILIIVATSTARGARARSTDPEVRHLGQAIAASIIAAAVTMGTFDAFFYRIFTGLLFFMVGAAGALWRLELSRRGARPWSLWEMWVLPDWTRARAQPTLQGGKQ